VHTAQCFDNMSCLNLVLLFILLELQVSDVWEAEIRGCSIRAVELLRSDNCNAIQIDFYLWDEAKAHAVDIAKWPIHKKRTIYY
jgi:hypothetical protein